MFTGGGCGPFDGFFPVEGFQFVDDFLLVFYLTLLIQISMHPVDAVLFLFFRVRAVVAGKGHNNAGVDLDDLYGDAVQKIPVMGDGQYSALICREITFEPADRIHIEMVGGLIQQDDIGGEQQKFAQRYPCLLAAGKRTDGFVILRLLKAEPL